MKRVIPETAIILVIGVSFLSIIGYKALKSYNSTELIKVENTNKTKILENQNEQNIEKLKLIANQKIMKIQNSRNYYKSLIDESELDYNDIDYDEEKEFKLSDLASSIYPKLPPSLAKLIDKEEFQEAIIKTVEKKPDIINTFV